MKREITCTVQKEDAGRLLKHFLKTPMGLSEKEIRRAKFREDGLRVNGQRRKTNALLREGDRIEVLLETGEEKTILFGLTGTGYFDMVAYEKFHNGEMSDYIPTDEELAAGFAGMPQIQ